MTTSRTISTWVLGVVLVLVCSPLISNVVYTYTRAGESARVHAATASTLNFQARLLGSNGALVSDGSYSVQFKLYDAVTGGTNEWTETQTVTVKNGYFSSYLGTVTPFSGSIDWSQEKWLTMNVNGDGEMTPRIKLTAVPYALRSGQADSLTITGGTVTGDNLLQKAPGAVQSINSANTGLRFNQTGAGSLVQLQGNGLDVFTVSKAGAVTAAGNAAILGGILTLGSTTQASTIVMNDGAGNTATLSFGTFTGNRTYTLPDASGEICLTTTCGGGGLSFLQDGNDFGEDGVLGTTDNYALRFITNNTEKFTILANGNIGVGDTTPSALFTVGTADALTITASGNLATAGTITSTGLITANGGLKLNLGGVSGLLKVDASGNVGLATSGTDYEQPLTFGNGLTRTGNSVVLGGSLTANTTVDLGSYSLTFNNGGTLNIGTTTMPYTSKLNVGGNLLTTSSDYNLFSANSSMGAYGYFRAVETSDTIGRFEIGGADIAGLSQGGRTLVLNPLGGNVGVGGDLTPDGLFSVGSTSQFQVDANGTIIAANSGNTINGLIINSGALSGISTISASGAITAATAGNTINGLIINAGALSGVTSISASGSITAATSNTINGLSINAGALSGITGFGQSSGNFSVIGSGSITLGAGTNALTIDSSAFDVSSTGALSGVTTLSMSGAITAATTVNTINGLIINSGALSGITGMTFTSGGLNLNGGGITNAGTIGGVTGLTFISGNLAMGNGNITGVNSLTATTVNTGTVTNAGILNLTATGAGNDVILSAADQIQLNAGTTIELQDNTNVTGSLNITGAITSTNSVKFTTSAGNPAYAEGLLFYDNTQKALSYYNSEAEITMNLGQEQYIYVYNNTGATITDRQAVYINGANAGVPTVALARADALTTAQAVGVTTHAIENGTYGFVTRFGELNNVNTSTFVSGDTLYLSATTAGLLTNVRPNQPNFTNPIARVTDVNATTGKILVTVGDTRQGAMTTGSIAFGGTDGFIREDNANFFWDNTNKRLGIGDNTPAATLTVGNGDLFQVAGATGNVSTSGTITVAGLATLNGGLTMQTGDTFTFNGDAFTDFTSNGLVNTAGVLSLDVTTAGTVAGTSSNSGLITAADGLSLLRGCSNGQLLKWNGTVWACSADNTGISDSRLKENVSSIGSVLDQIKNVNVVNFNFKCMDPTYTDMRFTCDQQTGVIAQDLGAVFPGLVQMNAQGFNEVNFGALNFYTLKAVTELAQKIDGSGNATLNNISTGGVLRLTANGALQNINGLNLSSGGASIVGGLNNNGSGITAAGAITGVTTIGARAITLDADSGNNLLSLKKDGNGVFTVFNNGALELKLDSSNAFTVKGANGDNALNIDTLTGKVKIGAGNNGKTVLFVLDTKTSGGDPAGVNGAQYYNSSMKKFRCYQNDKWQDCLQTAFSEYTIANSGNPWTQPSGDHELPGENRTWIDLGNANQARLLINVSAAGTQGASCRLQYSLTETNPVWHDLTDNGGTTIDRTGAVKGDWLQIKNEAKGEVLVRVYCSGGNNSTTVEYTSIRTQIR